nr:MAG TPA: hypothetical protein [Caudoviricetes sp.]
MVQHSLVAQADKKKNEARLHTACYEIFAKEGNNERILFLCKCNSQQAYDIRAV